MTTTFTSNDLDTAVREAVQQSRCGRWRAVYRLGVVFIVEDTVLAVGTPLVVARDGVLEPGGAQ